MTDDKTATDRLRELLDERGVEYDTHGERYGTWYDTPLGGRVYVAENNAGYLHVKSDAMTPEQAIAATLGRGTCHDTGECLAFRCSECGFGVEDIFINDERVYFDAFPMYCPHCGRRVVKADA